MPLADEQAVAIETVSGEDGEAAVFGVGCGAEMPPVAASADEGASGLADAVDGMEVVAVVLEDIVCGSMDKYPKASSKLRTYHAEHEERLSLSDALPQRQAGHFAVSLLQLIS